MTSKASRTSGLYAGLELITSRSDTLIHVERRQQVLKAIIQQFIQTAQPVGSNTVLVSYKFSVSPATIRNDMAALEREGLIYQPHTSAGRVPTSMAYRLYVNAIADYETARTHALQKLQKIQLQYHLEKAREKIYDAVSLLAHSTENISFATLPDNDRTFYLGLSNVLRQPEFMYDSVRASQVVEVLERSYNFVNTLRNLDIDNTIKVFIGDENILEQIQSCSIIVTKYNFKGYKGFMGILGPMRMDYPFNMVMVEEVKKLLNM